MHQKETLENLDHQECRAFRVLQDLADWCTLAGGGLSVPLEPNWSTVEEWPAHTMVNLGEAPTTFAWLITHSTTLAVAMVITPHYMEVKFTLVPLIDWQTTWITILFPVLFVRSP